MKKALKDLLQSLGDRMDAATERLDNLGRKLEHGINTVSEHLDERLNAYEEDVLKRIDENDDDDQKVESNKPKAG